MKELIVKNKNILKTEDRSDPVTGRLLITFNNGLRLSVLRGGAAMCSREKPFEILIINSTKNLNLEEDKNDPIIGYCSANKVNNYIARIGNI